MISFVLSSKLVNFNLIQPNIFAMNPTAAHDDRVPGIEISYKS